MTERGGLELENEVARIYELLGAEVCCRRSIKSYEIDVCAKVRVGPLVVAVVIECKQYSGAKMVTDVDMRSFVVKLLAARECGQADKGVFVTTTDYTRNARATAEQHGIECQTLSDLYNQLVDFRPYVARMKSDYEGSTLCQWYVDQTGSEIEDYDALLSRADGTRYFHKPLLGYVQGLMAGREQKVALLGNFGTGKSSFCRRLLSVLLEKYLHTPGSPLPVFIELRDFRSGIDIHQLVSSQFRRYGVRIDVSLCVELQRMGRLLFLLDGLDEMSTKVDRVVINENLRELDRLVTEGRSSYLVTCRTHFFQERVAEEFLSGHKVVYLVEWDLSDLKAYLTRRFPTDWKQLYDAIHSSTRLRDIARTPQFVEMLLGTFSTVSTDRLKTIRSVDVYDESVKKWIDKETRRRGAVMNGAQRAQFARTLARKLFTNEISRLHYRELYDFAREFSGYGDPTRLDYFDTDVRTCTFITKDGEGNYGFRHRSFMEYFVAGLVRDEIRNGKPDLVASKLLSEEVFMFLGEWEYTEPEIQTLQQWVERHDASSILRTNSSSVLIMKDIPLSTKAETALRSGADAWSVLRMAMTRNDSAGISQAMETLYPDMIRIARRFLESNDLQCEYAAEDAVQDTLLKIWRLPIDAARGRLLSYDLKRYFVAVLRNSIVDRLRLHRRRETLPLHAIPEADLPWTLDRIESRLSAEELLQRVSEILTEREMNLFRMLFLEQKTITEVASQLEIHQAAARMLAIRIRQKIYRNIRRHDEH